MEYDAAFFSCCFSAVDILESFDNHPPLILPSSTFHLELGKAVVDPALFEQLARLQDVIRQLPCSEHRPEPDPVDQVGTLAVHHSPL